MKAFVGVTDNDWFAFLAGLPGIDDKALIEVLAKKGIVSKEELLEEIERIKIRR